MLGNGRPFVLEMVNPRRRYNVTEEDFLQLKNQINKSKDVNVTDLDFPDENCFKELSHSANSKVKAYCCIITVDKINKDLVDKLNSSQDIQIKQMTPLRVLHRRTLMVRDKVIHKCHVEWLNDHYGVCFVLSSAGTYIKEFVHGDLNRTKPNIKSLLNTEADIIQLDVLYLYDKISEETVKHFDSLVTQYTGKLNK